MMLNVKPIGTHNGTVTPLTFDQTQNLLNFQT